MSVAGLDAGAGEPNGEAVAVVIPARSLRIGSSAELRAPHEPRVFQQAARLQVLNQGADRLIDLVGLLFQTDCDAAMVVPVVARAVVTAPDLDEANVRIDGDLPKDPAPKILLAERRCSQDRG